MTTNLLTKSKILLLLLWGSIQLMSAQTETIYIDFGLSSASTVSPWNNISNNVSGSISNLINSSTVSTGISVAITDGFPGINSNGTNSPNASLGFPSTATNDSFYGAATDGGSFLFSNLIIGKDYTLTFFASRTGVSDNRQATYTVVGATSQAVSLDASNNTDNTVSITFKPNTDGTAVLNVSKGAANTNTSSFFYLGLIKLQYLTAASTYTNNALQVDFGSSTNQSSGNWNNMTNALTTGSLSNLINKGGVTTNISLAVTDSFNYINENGTTGAGQSLGLPSTATADSFFGNTVAFLGKTEPTGAIKYSNFDPNIDLSLTIYASRIDYVEIDNKETQYTIEGLTTEIVYLNAANNTNKSVSKTIKPKADGTVTITVTKGPNNNNTNGFFYLGAMIIEYTPVPAIALSSPNGGEFWQVGKTTQINWTSSNLSSSITLEYSTNNGSTWNTISNAVSNLTNSYNWTVPSAASTNCLVRATSGTVSDTSNAVFEVSNDATNSNIVVIGSSTAEGTGASTLAKSWVSLYAEELYKNDTRMNVINLGKGGYTTYKVLPTGSTIPAGVTATIDTDRNITKALSYNPIAIIINMPSNDTANGYTVADQMANYNTIHHDAFINGVPLWIATSQPRNFSDLTKIQDQIAVRDAILTAYPILAINFWSDIAETDGTILNGLNSGDGVHLNDVGHAILFNKVKAANILTTLAPVCSITTWNGTSWTNSAPKVSSSAIMTGNYTATSDIETCSLSVSNNATVLIPSNYTISVNGSVSVQNGSTLQLNNNANLVQVENVANTGNITVYRNSALIKRLDYTLWSSPVSGTQTLKDFSPNTLDTRFYDYNLTLNSYTVINSLTTTFNAAKGYLIRSPNNHPTTATTWTGQYTGVPNNGNINFTLTDGGAGFRYNLVGNPYPSPINIVDFVNNNPNITGTLYFFRKNNYAPGSGYSTWTSVGGFVTNGDSEAVDPNDIIRTGQGFFVEANALGTSLNFTNAMRRNDTADIFFKSTNSQVDKNRIWINITNTSGSFSQTLIGYFTNGTDGIDQNIEGKFFGDGDIAINTLNNAVEYAIQGKGLPFNTADTFPLNFKTNTAGSFQIAIDHVDGLFSGNQDIYLKDNETNIIHDLKLNPYTFTAQAGTFSNRFVIIYQNNTLGVSNPDAITNKVIVYKSEESILINANLENIKSIKVFDIQGRLILTQNDVNDSSSSIVAPSTNEVLLVQVTLENNRIITQKIVN